MKRLAVVFALAACGTGTEPTPPVVAADPWAGTWVLETVNGQLLPATVPITASASETIYHRTLDLWPGGAGLGLWEDSTTSATLGNLSGAAAVTWYTVGDSLFVFRTAPVVGYVNPLMTFAMQADSTLVRVNVGVEIYRR